MDKINQTGGIMGRKIHYTLRDGQSDPSTFACILQNELSTGKYDYIFGGWTSSSRQKMKPIIELKLNQKTEYSILIIN